MNRLLEKLGNLYFTRRALPYWCILLFDCLVVLLSGVICYALDRGIDETVRKFLPLLGTLCFYLIFYLIGFRTMKTYQGVLRYSTFTDLSRVGLATLIGAGAIGVLRIFFHADKWFSWMVPVRVKELAFTFILSTTVMCAMRVLVKFFHDLILRDKDTKRVFIYGVREGGLILAKSIKMESPLRFSLKGFVTDNDEMMGHLLMGVKVYRNDDHLVEHMKRLGVKTLLVSPLKNKDFANNPAMSDRLLQAGVSVYTIHLAQKWDGKSDITASELREIQIEDLLPREEIQVDMEAVGRMLRGRRILITGSAGSIGSEMVHQIAKFDPERLILIDEAETPQHDIRLMMARDFPGVKSEGIVTSITKHRRMESLFRVYKPDYVFHAAAYKHVPMMEDNPSEAVQNNIDGTRVLADLSVKYGVKKFVMISTDKAVNPTNVMGCSKRICEIYVQSLDKAIKDGKVQGTTQFVTTRFGNVLGSNGSVIPLFKEQIKKGGPVTVTHPDIIRFFMLIPEACKLVLEAGTMGKGGEIFVFDMGQPVKIAELAERMIRLSGAKNVEIKYTGLRDGEKLYEEVLNDQEITKPTFNAKIKIAQVREYDYEQAKVEIQALIDQSYLYDDMETVRKMKAIVPEYKSQHSKYESLDK